MLSSEILSLPLEIRSNISEDSIQEEESTPDLFTENNVHKFNSEINEEVVDSDEDDHVETDQDLLEIPSFLRRQSK
jgi:hypothetical protein